MPADALDPVVDAAALERVATARERFPALATPGLVALDNAATTHRPQAVLEALTRFYVEANANVHRAQHRLGVAATASYEGARARVARFLRADPDEIVFTRNATEAANLVARGWLAPRLGPGDVVVVTALEHHSNLLPWRLACRAAGAELVVLPMDARGRLAPVRALPDRTVLLATTRVSNALGSLVDVEPLVGLAHGVGAAVLVDATQALGHLPLDAGTEAADFVMASAHKAYGPMGVGVLRGRAQRLAELEPVFSGGEMVESVSATEEVWAPVPHRFEAGTPAAAPVSAFVPALDLLDELGLHAIRAHERGLLERLLEGLEAVDGVELLGPPSAAERSGSVSLVLPGADVHVAATVLDLAGVAVRAGMHCAEPTLLALGQPGGSLRVSLALYSSTDDLDALLAVLPEAVAAAS